MLKSKFFVWSIAALASATASASNELFVSEGASGQVRLVGLDVLVKPPAVGFEVRMTVPEGARVDTSRCLQGLAGLQIATCVFNGKEVVVLAVREGLKPFAEGMLSLGTIEIHGGSGGVPAVTKFAVSDPAGQPLDAAVRASEKPAGGERVERLR